MASYSNKVLNASLRTSGVQKDFTWAPFFPPKQTVSNYLATHYAFYKANVFVESFDLLKHVSLDGSLKFSIFICCYLYMYKEALKVSLITYF